MNSKTNNILLMRKSLQKTYLALLAMVVLCASVAAAAVPVDLPDAEQAWLTEHPVIRVANEPDYPPFVFISNGKPTGYSIDYVEMLAQRLGIQLEYVQDTWGNLLKKAEKKDVDLVPTIIKHPGERERYLEFTQPYKKVVNVIVVRNDIEGIEEMEHLNGLRVALVTGDSMVKAAKRIVPGMHDLYSDNYSEALKAVALGKADATLLELPVADYLIHAMSLTNLKMVAETETIEGEDRNHRLAVRKDWAIFARILDKAMQSLSPAELHQLDEKWQAYTARLKEPKLNLTKQEKTWLAEHPRLRMGFHADSPPLDFLTEDGNHKGIITDYLKIISERLGIAIEPVLGLSWSEVLEKAKRKKIDVISLLTKREQRSKYLLFGKPFIKNYLTLVTRDDSPFITGLGEYYAKTRSV